MSNSLSGVDPLHTPRKEYSSGYQPRRLFSDYKKPLDDSRSLCLKTFVIFVIVIGAIALVTGVLALLAVKGVLPHNINSMAQLAKIGEVNSALMTGAGFLLFALGIVAWTCHVHKENQAKIYFQKQRI